MIVGAPGAGKSSVGAALAQRLNVPFLDSDSMIEKAAGKTVADIFTDDGEAAFRDLEAKAIATALQGTDAVLSLGGGALGNAATRALLLDHTVVWLTVTLSDAVSRVGMNRDRPLLLGNVRGKLADLMSAREPIYREAANIIVDTHEKSVEQIADVVSEQVTAI